MKKARNIWGYGIIRDMEKNTINDNSIKEEEIKEDTENVFLAKFKSFSPKVRRRIKVVFYSIMLICVVMVAKNEIVGLDFSRMRSIFISHNYGTLTIIGFVGIIAFLAAGLYDLVIKRYEKINAGWLEVLAIGWMSQAFNNFVGLGGLTGGTIRNNFYQSVGVSDEKALTISVKAWLANLLGLFALVLISLPEAFHAHSFKFVIIPAIMCLYIPIYFFGGKIKIGKLNLRKTVLNRMSYSEKFEMLIASILDWFLAAIFFAMVVKLFEPSADMFLCFFVYGVSVTIGLLSFIPSGLGTFDVTCLTLFAGAGYSTNNILLSILIYRVSYYLVPWAVSSIALGVKWAGKRLVDVVGDAGGRMAPLVLSAGTFLMGLMTVLSAITPEIHVREEIIKEILPPSMTFLIKLAALTAGNIMIILSKGIAERIGRIHIFVVILLMFSAVCCLLKGLDYEEALILLGFCMILVSKGHYFTKSSMLLDIKNIGECVVLCLITPIVNILYIRHFSVMMIEASDWNLKTYQMSLFSISAIVISILILFGRSIKLSLNDVTEEDEEKFNEFIKKYEANEYTHLFYLKDKNVFYNSKGDVMMLYRPYGNNIFVLSDPIGNRENFEEAIEEMVDFATSHDMVVSFYEIAGENLELYCNQGFRFLKIGEDAMVKLENFSYVGKKNHGLRQIRNKFEKSGMTFEVVNPPYGKDFLNELRIISQDWLGSRSEMGFSLGFFDEEYISKAPIAILKSDERIEAFATILPIYNTNVLSIDLMRFRGDAPAGVMDSVFISLFSWGKEQGYEYFNLGMAPMSNVGNKPYSHGIDKLVSYIYDYGNKVYNFKGLRGYKEKYHPFWTNKYIVYRNNKGLPGVLIALLSVVRSGNGTGGSK